MSTEFNPFKGTDSNRFSCDEMKVEETKKFFNRICHDLTAPSNEYNPDSTVKDLRKFLQRPGFNRILYSEISNFVFTLNPRSSANLLHNVDNLVNYAMNDNSEIENKDKDYRKIVIKLYDHCNLAAIQTGNAKIILEKGVSEAKDDLEKSLKGLEREYVTILGVFAAIVLAFVGGITFSSSVLQNIDKVNLLRLFAVIDALAVILLGILHMLMCFICQINGIRLELDGRWCATVIGTLAILTLLGLKCEF